MWLRCRKGFKKSCEITGAKLAVELMVSSSLQNLQQPGFVFRPMAQKTSCVDTEGWEMFKGDFDALF